MSASLIYNLCIMFFTRSRNDFSVCLKCWNDVGYSSARASSSLVLVLFLLRLLLSSSSVLTTGHNRSQQFSTVHNSSPRFTTVHNSSQHSLQHFTAIYNTPQFPWFADYSLMILWWFSSDANDGREERKGKRGFLRYVQAFPTVMHHLANSFFCFLVLHINLFSFLCALGSVALCPFAEVNTELC